MGKLITTLFAQSIISMIEVKEHMCGIYIPEAFKNGFFDSMRSNYECSLNNCHLNGDGMWVTNELTSGDGRGNKINHSRFYWRIEPNYCIHGQPFYDADRIFKLFKASETKKTLIETGKCSICLEWFEFLPPTKNVWGLRQGPVHITAYENGKKIWTSKKDIRKTGWKKEFTKFVEKQYEWKREQA